ncbi:MAG: HypC/HybG/HupF family hydrogenase formation chaperone [Infirmifilum sp.]
MCWGAPAVVLDISGATAKVDYGDGIPREVFIGISEGKLEKGELVMVHAGVIISKLTPEGVLEQISFIREVIGEEDTPWTQMYEKILKLAEELRGGKQV